jgi:hypothetical protein
MQARIVEMLEFLKRRSLPEGAISIRCLNAEVANDAIVPVANVVNGSEIHVVDVAAGFGVHYNGHWYNLASGAVIK